MSKESLKKVHLIYGIVLGLLLCVVGVLFIVMCLDIYHSGPSPFTRQSVYEHFSKISVFAYIFIALSIGGVVLNIVAPLEKERLKGAANDGLVLNRLSRKLKSLSPYGSEKIEKQRALRLVLIIISIILVIGASVASLVHVLNTYDASSADINGEVTRAALTVLRYFIVPFAYLTVTAFVCKSSVKKELEIVKNELKNPKTGDTVAENDKNAGTFTKLSYELCDTAKRISEPKKWHKYLSIGIKCLVGCVAIAFIIIGVINGGMSDVVTKAINICTECIGMG